MTYFIDIDDTICTLVEPGDYASASPIQRAIDKVNDLYDQGHTIVFWTARGALSGKDWRHLTATQLNLWGVKHHELRLDKPAYDVFIDDKNINAKDWLDA